MIREVAIRTPENIVFSYRLAGLATRAAAALIDTLLLAFVIGVVVSAAAFVGELVKQVDRFAGGTIFGMGLALAFVIVFGYFALFEGLWNGQTPGKRAVRIRVVKDRGQAVRLLDSVLRNLLRIADILPGLYLVAAISALLTERNKRLGDLAAGTIVVHVEPVSSPTRASAPRQRYNSVREDLPLASRVRAAITTQEAELAREILERQGMAPDQRARAAAQVAERFRDRLGISATYSFLSDETLLGDIIEVIERGDELSEST